MSNTESEMAGQLVSFWFTAFPKPAITQNLTRCNGFTCTKTLNLSKTYVLVYLVELYLTFLHVQLQSVRVLLQICQLNVWFQHVCGYFVSLLKILHHLLIEVYSHLF